MNNKNNRCDKKSYKKIISIPLIPALIIVISIICLILIFLIKNVMSSDYSNDIFSNEEISLDKSEKKDTTDNTLTVLLPNSETQIDDIPIKEVQEKKEEQKATDTYTYTTSNGKRYDVIASLNIPSLGINYPILSETSTELLKISLNKYWGANPNEIGNMVVIGHNYKNNKFFGKLHNIEIGAIVQITDLTGRMLDYKVYTTDVIDPYDNSCTSQLTNGQTEITLITCYYENGNTHATKRFIVKARAN